MLILRRKKLEEFIKKEVRQNCISILKEQFDDYEKRRFNFATAVDYINDLVAAGIPFEAGKGYQVIINKDIDIWLNVKTNICSINGTQFNDGITTLIEYYGR